MRTLGNSWENKEREEVMEKEDEKEEEMEEQEEMEQYVIRVAP